MFGLVWKEIVTRRLEIILGSLVVATAIASVVAIRSITAAADEKVHAVAHVLGKNMLIVPAETDLAAFYLHEYGEASLPDSFPATLRDSSIASHLRTIEPQLLANVDVRGEHLLLAGVQFSQDPDPGPAGRTLLDPAFVGAEAAGRLKLAKGDRFDVRGKELAVIEVLPPKGSEDDITVFTPLAAAQTILGRPGRINAIRVGGCWCSLDVPALGASVEKILPGTRAITIAGVLKAQKGLVATMRKYSVVIFLVALSIAGATVANLTRTNVRGRLREIGTLLAIGASPRRIQWVFIVRAALAGLVGGVVGFAMGSWLSSRLGAIVLEGPAKPPPSLVLVAPALALVVSIVFSYLPARQASRLDPVSILRKE